LVQLTLKRLLEFEQTGEWPGIKDGMAADAAVLMFHKLSRSADAQLVLVQ
jgi:hypothetical protein